MKQKYRYQQNSTIHLIGVHGYITMHLDSHLSYSLYFIQKGMDGTVLI